MKFLILVFAIISIQSEAKYIRDTGYDMSLADVCDFYLEKSNELSCPEDNYLTQFGFRYCRKYLNKNKNFKPETQFILNNIRNCLILALDDRSDLTCENVKPIGLESHVSCYINNDFCSIKGIDKLQIYWYLKAEIRNEDVSEFRKTINNYCQNNGVIFL